MVHREKESMARESALESADVQLVASFEQAQAEFDPDTPFRILILGDWSGRSNRNLSASSAELFGWRPLLVDRDNLDLLIAKLGAKLHLPLADGSLSLTITFNQLADFHPDRIFERLEIFQALRGTRERLQNPKTFNAAAQEVRKWANIKSSESRPQQITSDAPSSDRAASSGGGLLDQILEAAPSEPRTPVSRGKPVSPEISAFVREAVKPYLISVDEMEEEQLLAAVDSAVGAEMAAILHNRDFQALESAWRALDFLVSRLETGSEMKVYLLDISEEEFERDLGSTEDLESTAAFKLMVQDTVGTSGGLPWAVIAANYVFDPESQSIRNLERISHIAKSARAPFIAAANSQLLQGDSFPEVAELQTPNPEASDAWDSLVRSSDACYLGLALPRFLLRLPYGSATEPAERFNFEEMPEDIKARHESYLWGNPAFAVVYLLGKAFSESGWNFRPGDLQEIEGLPLHVSSCEGETEIKPCAEVLMTIRAAEEIINRGLMPLISMKETDTVRVGIFQSVAGTRLAGRWDQA